MLDRFRDATMQRRRDWQTSRHRFQNGVRDAFLVLIWRRLARVQKKVRARVELHEFRLREKADEVHILRNTETGRQHFQFRLQRSFSGNKEFGVRIVLFKNRERAQAGGHAFFWN